MGQGNRAAVVRISLFLAFVTGGLSCASAQPNIIHIVADDLGWTDLSSDRTNKGNGSAFYQTPHIDRLALEGTAFTSAYALPTCVPTRMALLSGQYATRTHSYYVSDIFGDENDALLGATNENKLDPNATTLGETIQGAGYTTAHVGKFHIVNDPAEIVSDHGFDYNYGGTRSGAPGDYFATNGSFTNAVGAELNAYAAPYTQEYINANLKPYANGADVDSLVGTNKHLTDATIDAAVEFLDDRVSADDGPFYMNLAFNAVHTPIQSRPDLDAKYNEVLADNGGVSPDPRHDNAAYAGMLEGMDQAIGRLLDKLYDPNGDGDLSDSIAEETVIVFYGDNGGSTQGTSTEPLRESKGSQYEGGVRVPLIAWSPGRVQAGAITDEPVHSVDFYPTFAELAAAPTPDPATHVLDGLSLADLITGQTSQLDRDGVFFHYPGYQGGNVPTSTMVLDAGGVRRKLMYFYENRQFEFYDLDADLGETTDLADGDLSPGEYKLAARATVALREWLDETGAEYPTVRADGSPVPAPQHLPTIAFDLNADLHGQSTATLEKLGVTLTLAARGDTATFDADASAAGVASALDSGGANQRRRINGSLVTPEAIELSFDTDVMLKSLTLEAFNATGAESVVLSLVSGDNPFTGLDGYDTDGFTLGADSLAFATESGGMAAGEFLLEFGVLGRDELFLPAGTVLSLTADPVVGSGILLNAISIAQPLSALAQVLLDYNLDGAIDPLDYEVWRSTYGSTTDLRADGNADGVVDAADYALWRDAYASISGNALAVPEPGSMVLLTLSLISTGCIYLRVR
ncbi:Arylsulfatase [Planctomycetes bacterium MalM25]|nr:Arylsulfatase [Planctomycetes bacterium MalM25]